MSSVKLHDTDLSHRLDPGPSARIRRVFEGAPKPCVVTMGSFDGLHAGHRAVVGAALKEGHRQRLPVVAVTFSPRPEAFFNPSALPDLTATVDDRVRSLQAVGVDHVCVLPFDEEVARVSDTEFVGLLTESLGARALVVGEDFRLGRGRAGSPQRVRACGLPVLEVALVRDHDDRKISSTDLRVARASGS